MAKLIISNSFHKTEAAAYAADDMSISKTQALQVRKKLCGITGCTCSGEMGERPEDAIVDTHGNRYYVEIPGPDRLQLGLIG